MASQACLLNSAESGKALLDNAEKETDTYAMDVLRSYVALLKHWDAQSRAGQDPTETVESN